MDPSHTLHDLLWPVTTLTLVKDEIEETLDPGLASSGSHNVEYRDGSVIKKVKGMWEREA